MSMQEMENMLTEHSATRVPMTDSDFPLPHAGNKGYKKPPKLAPEVAFVYRGGVVPRHEPDIRVVEKNGELIARDFNPLPEGAVATGADMFPWPTLPPFEQEQVKAPTPNPKNVMGRKRLPVSAVIPWPALMRIAEAMQYGAFESPNPQGGKGYRPFNWREQAIEAMGYIDACDRHKARWIEGQDVDPKSLATELAHAAASLIILIDAIENDTWVDNRPAVRKQSASRILDNYESQRKE